MSSAADAGAKALAAGDFTLAISNLTTALQSSQSPLWLINRSTAYQRQTPPNHEAALHDAEAAIRAASARNRREQMATAQFRRAVALYGMERYGDARMCLAWCSRLHEKEKGLTIWQAKIKREYEARGGEDAECNVVTVKEMPEETAETEAGKPGRVKEVASTDGGMKGAAANGSIDADIDAVTAGDSSGPSPVQTSAPHQTPREKIRHEWFQSQQFVTITVFAKGLPKDTVEVTFESGSVELGFPVAVSNSTYDLTFSPLYSAIDPVKSSYTVGSTKIEIILHKINAAKWASLEGKVPIPASTSSQQDPPAPSIPAAVLQDKPPSYPTSSRNGPKDWDSLASSALKATRPADNPNEGDDFDDEDDGGDPVNGFFKKMYAGADDDTKKAMMKSYQESNGTALSTNWSEVGKGPVKTQPPEGVVAKKWDE